MYIWPWKWKDKPQPEKISAKHVTDKGPVSKTCKELLTHNNQKKEPNFSNGPKIWSGTSPKKIYRWKISIWKVAPHKMLLGSCKLKPQWETTPTRLAKIQNTNSQMLVRMWGNRRSYSLLMGMQNGAATFKESLAISYKMKHSVLHVHESVSVL